MTIHDFDMARFFLGEVVEVTATGANLISDEIAAAGDIDAAVVVLRGARGTLCSITNSRRCAFGYDQRLEAFGELGHAHRRQPASDQRPVLRRRPTPRWRRRTTTSSSTGTPRPTAPRWTTSSPRSRPVRCRLPASADGRAALVLADAANESLRTGTTVKVSET